MLSFSNKIVLITGGASGIGKIMVGKALARHADQLIVWDYNRQAMDQLLIDYAAHASNIHCIAVDLNDPEQLQEAIRTTLHQFPSIDILINNAGVVSGKNFVDHTAAEIDRTLQINISAYLHLTHALLPGMLSRNRGAICNIASNAGLVAVPKMSVYVASKWAVAGWSMSLNLEMKKAKSKIRITTVLPYYINTGMFDGVKSKIVPIQDPEKVSERIIRAIEQQQSTLSIPLPYRLIRLMEAIFPERIYEYLMDRIFGVYDSMNEFRGRPSEGC